MTSDDFQARADENENEDEEDVFEQGRLAHISLTFNDLHMPLVLPVNCNLFQLRRLLQRRAADLSMPQDGSTLKLYLLKQNQRAPLCDSAVLHNALKNHMIERMHLQAELVPHSPQILREV